MIKGKGPEENGHKRKKLRKQRREKFHSTETGVWGRGEKNDDLRSFIKKETGGKKNAVIKRGNTGGGGWGLKTKKAKGTGGGVWKDQNCAADRERNEKQKKENWRENKKKPCQAGQDSVKEGQGFGKNYALNTVSREGLTGSKRKKMTETGGDGGCR